MMLYHGLISIETIALCCVSMFGILVTSSSPAYDIKLPPVATAAFDFWQWQVTTGVVPVKGVPHISGQGTPLFFA